MTLLAPTRWWDAWPDHVWAGTSVEDQATANARIPELLQVPARIRWISAEPLLSAVDVSRWLNCEHCKGLLAHGSGSGGSVRTCPAFHSHQISWVVAGGESGRDPRPVHPAWARSLRDQCIRAGVAFHWKQWGEWAPSGEWSDTVNCKLHNQRDGRLVPVDSGWVHWHDASDYISMRRFGKKQSGRLLDGRTWDEYPTVG